MPRAGIKYAPVAVVTVVLVAPVSDCVAVIVTPGSTAPLSSVNTPRNAACATCPKVMPALRSAARLTLTTLSTDRAERAMGVLRRRVNSKHLRFGKHTRPMHLERD